MKLRRFAQVLLLLVVAGLALAMREGPQPPGCPSSLAAADRHSTGSSCPDPDNHGHPCGPACPCACCPGTARTAAVAGSFVVEFDLLAQAICAPPPPDKVDIPHSDHLHPKEVFRRIFHPPRA